MVKNEKTEVASLDKAFRILNCLAQADGQVSLAVLSKQMGIPKSTLIRLLATMRSYGLVMQDSNTKQYCLGWALIYMGQAAAKSFDAIKAIRPFLERLAAETGETASLTMRRRNRVVYVDQVSGSSMIRSVPSIGAELYMHASASGKIILGGLSEELYNQTMADYALAKLTDKTIVDREQFRKEVQKAHELGYALDDEEGEPGCRCIAAPITNWHGEIIAALSITGPTTRIRPEDIPHIAETVCRIAREASMTISA